MSRVKSVMRSKEDLNRDLADQNSNARDNTLNNAGSYS